MKLHLPKQLFTALLAALTLAAPAALTLGSAAWGDVTVSPTDNPTTVSNTEGWSRTYTSVLRNTSGNNDNISAATYNSTEVGATIVTGGRIQINGGTANDTSDNVVSTYGGDLITGDSGHFFLQTYGKGQIDLSNNFYLGGSTEGTTGDYGDIRFGNNAPAGYDTNLTGNLYLLANSKLFSGGTNAILISGKVTDDVTEGDTTHSGSYTLTIQGEGYQFAGDINLTGMTLTDGSEVLLGGQTSATTVSVDTVTIGSDGTLTLGNTNATFGTVTNKGTLTLGPATLSGDVTNSGTLIIAGTLSGTGTLTNTDNGKVKVDTTNFFAFDGLDYTTADGKTNDVKAGFLIGEQKLKVLGEGVTYTGEVYINDSETGTTLTNGAVTMTIGTDDTFYVNDAWTYDAAASEGATAFHVASAGTLHLDKLEAVDGVISAVPAPIQNSGNVSIAAGTNEVTLNDLFGTTAITQDSTGTTTIAGSGVVNMDAALSVSGTIIIDGTGSLTNSDQTLTLDKLVLQGGTSATVTGSAAIITGDVVVGDDSILTLGSTVGDKGLVKGLITVKDGGKLVFSQGNVTGWNGGIDATRLTIEDGGILELAYGTSNETFNGVLNLSGTLQTAEDNGNDARWDLYTNSSIVVAAGSPQAKIKDVQIMLRANDRNIEVKDNATLTFSGGTITESGNEGNGILVKTGNGQLIFTEDTSFEATGIKVTAGSLLYRGATLENKSITINGGVFEYYLKDKDAHTHSNSISGSGTFRKSGSGTLNINGTAGTSEASLGGITVTEGSLNLQGTTYVNAVTVGGGELTFGGTNVTHNATSLKVYGGTVNINNSSTTLGTLSFGSSNGTTSGTTGGTVEFTKAEGQESATYTVGTIESVNAGGYTRNLTVGEGVTLEATNFTNDWGMGTITIDGTLIVNGEMKFATGNNDSTSNNVLTGSGIVRTEKLIIGNAGKYNFSGLTLKIGSGGIIKQNNNFWSDNVMLKLGALTIEATEDWSSDLDKIELVGATGAPTVFNTAGHTITMSAGGISGSGELKKAGEGTLTLSGANTYSGGTTIEAGTVTTQNASALGTGGVNMTGGELVVSNVDNTDTDLTVGGAIEMNAAATAKLATTGTTLSLGTTGSVKKSNADESQHVTIASDGTNAASMTAKAANAQLVQLQEDASFTIQDMTLTNTTITAATTTEVKLQNVTASNVVLAQGKFSTDAPMSVVGAGGTAFSASTSAITEGSSITIKASKGASLAVDLGDLSCVTAMGPGKYDLSITLSGVELDAYTGLEDGAGITFEGWLGELISASSGVKVSFSEAVAQEAPDAAAEGGAATGVTYSTGSVGTVINIKGLNVPEPASATLGLAALMMLCARRRRND